MNTKSILGNNPQCPDCNGTKFDNSIEIFDAICNGCGYVIHDFANPAKYLDVDSDTGPNQSDDDKDQGYQQDWTDVYTVTNSTEQRLATAYESLEHLGNALTLSAEVKKRTATIIATAAKENVIDGRSTEMVVAALIYITARGIGSPRPLVFIVDKIECNTSQLERLVRSLHCELDIEHQGCHPEDYLPYLCRKLGYSKAVKQQAVELIEAAHQAGLTNGKSPTGCAAAALYFASDGDQSQRTVATAVGVSKETIRLRLKEFRDEGVLDDR